MTESKPKTDESTPKASKPKSAPKASKPKSETVTMTRKDGAKRVVSTPGDKARARYDGFQEAK